MKKPRKHYQLFFSTLLAIQLLVCLPNSNIYANPVQSRFAATALSKQWQMQLTKTGIWKQGCPVDLNDLRLLSISYYNFSGVVHHGQMILNKSASFSALQIFKELFTQQFPLTMVSTLVEFKGDWKSAEAHNTTYGFYCDKNTNGIYSKESTGTVITINPVQNPELRWSTDPTVLPLWCKLLNPIYPCARSFSNSKIIVFPSGGMLSINRNLKLKGMVEKIVPVFN